RTGTRSLFSKFVLLLFFVRLVFRFLLPRAREISHSRVAARFARCFFYFAGSVIVFWGHCCLVSTTNTIPSIRRQFSCSSQHRAADCRLSQRMTGPAANHAVRHIRLRRRRWWNEHVADPVDGSNQGLSPLNVNLAAQSHY